MTITVTVSDVDYNALASLLLPQLEQSLDAAAWGNLPFFSGGLTGPRAEALLRRLSQEQKDALLCSYLNQNNRIIVQKLEEFAKTQGVSLRIDQVHAQA